ncbi:phytanoyl-CoA dioxygenase family protein [Endothiovibrio diazotrophicus]
MARGLVSGEDPREAARALEAVPVAAGAGDLIIWRHDLPHGSNRNHTHYPRAAQYIHMYPPDFPINPVWA